MQIAILMNFFILIVEEFNLLKKIAIFVNPKLIILMTRVKLTTVPILMKY